MKKIAVAIFAFFYLGLSAGATVHFHYCMGKLVKWDLGQNEKSDRCSKCGMMKMQSEKKKHCCKDESTTIKIVNDQKTATNNFDLPHLSLVAISSLFIELNTTLFSSVSKKTPVSHAPPRNDNTGIYLLNCVFRI